MRETVWYAEKGGGRLKETTVFPEYKKTLLKRIDDTAVPIKEGWDRLTFALFNCTQPIPIHSITFQDGRRWDEINGWNKEKLSQQELDDISTSVVEPDYTNTTHCYLCTQRIEPIELRLSFHQGCYDSRIREKQEGNSVKLIIEEEDINVLVSIYPIGMDPNVNSKYRKVLHKLIAMKVLQ